MAAAHQPALTIDPTLWKKFTKGDRIACARLISLVENSPESLPEIRDRLFPLQKGAVRIGITGPPGVGKSTVTAALALKARAADHKIAVIAVDPSSPFSGGAFLGDRIRMQDLMGDKDVFIRSLASRGGRGGLSPSTPYVADVFDAYGMDWIIIETIGVGQAELDVLTCADIVIVVLQPGTGDMIQALKSGIMEIGDIFLINKADLPGVEMVQESLRFIFQMDAHRDGYVAPPLLAASAQNDSGMDEVFTTVLSVIQKSVHEGRFAQKRQERIEREIKKSLQQKLWTRFIQITGVQKKIEERAGKFAQSRQSPFPFINKLYSMIKMEKNNEGNQNQT